MTRSWKDFVVGLTVIVGLAGVATLLLLFGEFAGGRHKTYDVTFALADASGLSKSSAVTLNGVRVAAITEIRIADPSNPAGGVELALKVREGVRIPRDVTMTLERGLVGEAALSMVAKPPPPGQAPAGFIEPGETYQAKASGFIESIATMIDGRLGAFSDAAKSIQTLSETYTKVGEQASALLTPRSVDEVDAQGQPATLPSTLARLDRAVRAAETWLGDDALRGDARSAAGRLTGLMDSATSAIEVWTQTGKSLERDAGELSEQGRAALREFAAVSGQLGETIVEVQTLVARVNRGEGTAGQLVTNPDLYNAITDAAVRLEKALAEAQLLFEKYRKDGVPIRF